MAHASSRYHTYPSPVSLTSQGTTQTGRKRQRRQDEVIPWHYQISIENNKSILLPWPVYACPDMLLRYRKAPPLLFGCLCYAECILTSPVPYRGTMSGVRAAQTVITPLEVNRPHHVAQSARNILYPRRVERRRRKAIKITYAVAG